MTPRARAAPGRLWKTTDLFQRLAHSASAPTSPPAHPIHYATRCVVSLCAITYLYAFWGAAVDLWPQQKGEPGQIHQMHRFAAQYIGARDTTAPQSTRSMPHVIAAAHHEPPRETENPILPLVFCTNATLGVVLDLMSALPVLHRRPRHDGVPQHHLGADFTPPSATGGGATELPGQVRAGSSRVLCAGDSCAL
jgi:hypothetical protein